MLSSIHGARAALGGSREAARGKHSQPKAAPRAEQLLAAHTAIRLLPSQQAAPRAEQQLQKTTDGK